MNTINITQESIDRCKALTSTIQYVGRAANRRALEVAAVESNDRLAREILVLFDTLLAGTYSPRQIDRLNEFVSVWRSLNDAS